MVVRCGEQGGSPYLQSKEGVKGFDGCDDSQKPEGTLRPGACYLPPLLGSHVRGVTLLSSFLP